MHIHVGFEMIYDCPQPTPMIFNLNVHFTRVSDLVGRDDLVVDPPVPMAAYRDGFGNWCTRIVAPKGRTRVSADALVNDTGLPDVIVPEAQQIPVPDLPEETLVFLLGSRYCETDRLSETAWNLFGQTPTGWGRVQAICDYVHRHITFGYEHARMTRTALEAFHDRTGVCRDFTHLAVAFCRCMNIPARYCTGYLGDIGVPPVDESDGFLCLVRGVPRRAMAYLRRAQQHAAHRQGVDRAWPRRRRRRAQQHVRSRHIDELQGMDRRGTHRLSQAALRGRHCRRPVRAALGSRTMRMSLMRRVLGMRRARCWGARPAVVVDNIRRIRGVREFEVQLASCTDDAASAGLRVKLDATRTAVRSDKPGRGGSRI